MEIAQWEPLLVLAIDVGLIQSVFHGAFKVPDCALAPARAGSSSNGLEFLCITRIAIFLMRAHRTERTRYWRQPFVLVAYGISTMCNPSIRASVKKLPSEQRPNEARDLDSSSAREHPRQGGREGGCGRALFPLLFDILNPRRSSPINPG